MPPLGRAEALSLERSQALQAVLDGLRLAIMAAASSDHPAVAASNRIFGALDRVVERAPDKPAQIGFAGIRAPASAPLLAVWLLWEAPFRA